VPEPEVFIATSRAHWGIENALHWQLDVSLREDAARNRKDHVRTAVQKFATEVAG
jgi:predicted transposase YbfD/YdcC